MPVMMEEVNEDGEFCIVSVDLREHIGLFMLMFLEDHWQEMFSSEMSPAPIVGI